MHCLGVDVTAEDGTKSHSYGDHHERDYEVVLEGSRPWSFTASLGNDESEDGQNEKEQDRIRRSAHCHGETQCPQPPGHGMQATWEHPASLQVLAGSHGQPTQPASVRLRRQAAKPPAPARQTMAITPTRNGTDDPAEVAEAAPDAEILTIFGPGRRPEAEIPDFVELEDGGVLVGDFVPPAPRGAEVGVVAAVGVVSLGAVVEVWVWVEGGGGVVRVVVLVVVPSVVVGLDDVVVVTGGPGLSARTELGENGGFTFGSLAPKVHASTLPGGGS
jgi:hypothetical protein